MTHQANVLVFTKASMSTQLIKMITIKLLLKQPHAVYKNTMELQFLKLLIL